MNTALRNDSVNSEVPKKQGSYQTTNLFRLTDATIELESQLKGLGHRLNKFDKPIPLVETPAVTHSGNRNTMYTEGTDTRFQHPCGAMSDIETDRFDFPFIDHQKYSMFMESQRGGFHTRNNEKDVYSSKCNVNTY
jgi:hypothetical protein